MYFSRGKNKLKDIYNISDMYKSYTKEVEKDSPYDVSVGEYSDVLSSFYKEVVNEVLDGETFEMPFGLGTVGVEKVKDKSFKKSARRIDWKTTVESGHTVYHLNQHSNGYSYIIAWRKYTEVIRNSHHYRFIASRAFKRRLASIIKERINDYFEN